ncbi:MAG: hypothetical protein RMK74_10355 [Myxococcales bacterium]|nr:hypothetical protein [Myxococcales bacterium]
MQVGSDDPHDIYEAAGARTRDVESRCVIVGNGGTKLQLLALVDALRAACKDDRTSLSVLYSIERPCALQWLDVVGHHGTQTVPYGDTPLRLEDVLAMRHVAPGRDAPPPLAIFERGRLTVHGRTLASDRTGLGYDVDETFAYHDEGARRASLWEQIPDLGERVPTWEKLALARPQLAERLRSELFETLTSLLREAAQYAFDTILHERKGRTRTELDSVRREFLDLAREALNGLRFESAWDQALGQLVNRVRRALITPSEPSPAEPTKRLGPAFEHAVRRRLCAWLEGHAPTCVQSVVARVLLVSTQVPGQVVFEGDALLLLKNGTVIAIEAKSHTSDVKDLDARLTNLQRSASNVASLVVCSPLYTQATDRRWFRFHHELAERLRRHGIPHLPFTLPGQPGRYSWPEGSSDSFEVDRFEEALARLLAEYELSEHARPVAVST